MNRLEMTLQDGWQFALGQKDCAPQGGYESVSLPHDWVIGREVSCPGDYTFREMSQGFFDRYDVGWYRRSVTLENLASE